MVASSFIRISLATSIVAAASVFAQTTGKADEWTYLNDRSTPQKLVESYYYAINNRLYVQAYSYFSQGFAPKDFETWSKGYADTKAVKVKFGPTEPDPGAGQIYWSLPVAVSALQIDGRTKVFTGCYQIHMIAPGMQTDPPYQPMGINSAALKETRESFDKIVPGNC